MTRTTRTMRVALGVGLLMLLSAAAFADGDDYRRGDGDRDGAHYAVNHEAYEHNRFYQRGLREGREDREHGRGFFIRDRRWDDRGDRDAYIAGYRDGFGPYGPGYREDHYYGGRYESQAYNFGFQDGLRIGGRDRDGRHSFRPTGGDRYEHADRGYNSWFGDKLAYRDAYRSGYAAGYEQGYGGR